MALVVALVLTSILAVPHLASASDSYESFRHEHAHEHLVEDDALTFEERRDLFQRRKAEVHAHNARNLSWKTAINHYSDYSDAELRIMLGYKRMGGRWSASSASSFIETHEQPSAEDDNDIIDTSKLAHEVDWRNTMTTSSAWVRNQGACGSCWAVAAVGALEMHNEKAGATPKKLSHNQLVDCTANPKHCGGTGGCKGATAELAMELVRKSGISADDDYQGGDGRCNTQAHSTLKIPSFVRLPVNKGSPLLDAVATQGPVVVSVDGSPWFSYSSGVFSGCDVNALVNHAVLAVGYGLDKDSQKNYWLIRNSWGHDWGEQGHIKIERHLKEGEHCGTDDKPKDGVFCDDAPPTVPVCGMCGILSDSVYPIIRPSQNKTRIAVQSHHFLNMVDGVSVP